MAFVAAALAINVSNSTALATVANGLTVVAGDGAGTGAFTLATSNNMDGSAVADGSATTGTGGSGTAIGVGVAINVADMTNRAVLGDNVHVTADGSQAVLMDLGLAQIADDEEGRVTRTRQFVGTLRYASPEQLAGATLDRRADVYSLGATLWELLALKPLFGITDHMPTPDLILKFHQTEIQLPVRVLTEIQLPMQERSCWVLMLDSDNC